MFNPIQDTTKHRVDSCLRGQRIVDAATVESRRENLRGQQRRFSFALSHVGFDNHQTGFGYCLGHTDGLTLHWT